MQARQQSYIDSEMKVVIEQVFLTVTGGVLQEDRDLLKAPFPC